MLEVSCYEIRNLCSDFGKGSSRVAPPADQSSAKEDDALAECQPADQIIETLVSLLDLRFT